ncbi:MAG: flavin-containing monooxygenase [Jatrophihabitans sp.]|uniref:flavin-containing monooxygenase n=1 Tax=Jatrophihabitans sp. TaxID=1932789 RepID=UPI003F7FAA80
MSAPREHDVVIVGAGFTGLGTAIRLRQAGVEDIVIVERSDRVGGTWRDATYPGAACDIPSLLYSFSFAPNPAWSRVYPSGAEIHRSIERLVDTHGLRPLIRFDTTVTSLTFDEPAGRWTVGTDAGEYRARAVVVASGPLSDASLPAIRGIDDYRGEKIHSARWRHDLDLTGRDVAVIGTGASAVQIVPELVRTAASVKVFQRTPGWVVPRLDAPVPAPARRLFAALPGAQRAARTALFAGHELAATGLVWDSPVTGLVQRLATAHLHHQVRDPWLRRQLTPDFRAGCKRLLVSSDWYPALQRPNCKLITWPIATLCPEGIRTSDGVTHALDAIVFATGYDVHLDGPPFPVTGRDGHSLATDWAGHAQAYKSITVSGYPNLFLMTGPNSGPGHNSLLVYVEAQIGYAVQGIRTLLQRDLAWLDVRPEVQQRHNERIQQRLRRTTWMSGCTSWYLTADGHNASMYPGFATQYRRQMRTFRLADHLVGDRVVRPASVAAAG